MTLREYLTARELTTEGFGALIQRNGSTVRKWLLGETTPDADAADAVFCETRGKVTALDFQLSRLQRAGRPMFGYGRRDGDDASAHAPAA